MCVGPIFTALPGGKRASSGSVHGQEQSWTFAWEHVWLQRRWSELGFRDAKSRQTLGFVQGEASPRFYRHFERQLCVWVLGDDFVPQGYTINVKWFFTKLQEFWVVTLRGILGPSAYHGFVRSIRVLGRIVDWTDEGISWEAYLRHELIRKSFGVTDRSVSTPGVKDRLDDIEGDLHRQSPRTAAPFKSVDFPRLGCRRHWRIAAAGS